MNNLKAYAFLTAALAMSSAPAWAVETTYTRTFYNKVRTYNFDGSEPFRNPVTGQGDAATWQFDSQLIRSIDMTNAGSNDNVHIHKVYDSHLGREVTKVTLGKDDRITAESNRTQLNSYGIEGGKLYVVELEFKLDDGWDFSMSPGEGTLWQLKGLPKDYQKGNPVLGLHVYGNQLKMTVAYPNTARQATAWPAQIAWTNKQYEPVTLPTRTLTKTQYHRVKLTFRADDKPTSFDTNFGVAPGQGFVSATFDDEFWFKHDTGTLHPDQLGDHNIGWGWYQWSGKPTADRTIYFSKHHVYEVN